MKTDTLKKLSISVIAGIIFSLALNALNISRLGFVKSIPQIIYLFVLFAATFFVTIHFSAKVGKNTTNFRIFAKKMNAQGILILNDAAELIEKSDKKLRGWIYLTNTFIIFADNNEPDLIEKKAHRIPLNKIRDISRFKPTRFTNDGLRITTTDNRIYDFLVGKTQLWVDSINESIDQKTHKKKSK